MAMAMAETSLDSASASVLSRYNKLVFDLYGLMGTENMSEAELQKLFEDYVSDTLQLADADYSGLGTMLSEAIFGDEPAGPYFDGYDFDATITSGQTTTLADYENVYYQIVETMKYRAPLRMLNGSGSFLENLNKFLNVKKRLEAAKKRIEITKSHQDLYKRTDALINGEDGLNSFNQRMLNFLIDPDGHDVNGSGTAVEGDVPKSYWDYIRTYDSAVLKVYEDEIYEINNRIDDALEEAYEEDDEDDEEDEDSDDGVPDIDVKAIIAEVQSEWDAAGKYQKPLDELAAHFKKLSDWGDAAYNEANDLRDRVTTINDEYTNYVSQLQNEVNSNSDSEDYKTVFGPEVQLAKSNGGEVLKNMDCVLSTRQYTRELSDFYSAHGYADQLVRSAGEDLVRELRSYEEAMDVDTPARVTNLPGLEKSMTNPDGEHSHNMLAQFMGILDEDTRALTSICSYYHDSHMQEVDVRTGEQIEDLDNRKMKAEEKTYTKSGLTPLNAADLVLETEVSGEDNNLELNVGESKSIDDVTNTMNAGLVLIDKIGQFLNDSRDNLYLNEYILMTFPNVVHHYNLDKSERETHNSNVESKKHGNKAVMHIVEEPYSKYNATQAEVEYIITGDPNTETSVAKVTAMLLGIRTLLNMVSIFTDSGKIRQSQAMSAPAGPFAPLVSVLLLVSWALLESVWDVEALMVEGAIDVPLLKQSNDWKLSVEGFAKGLVDTVSGQIQGYINRKTDTYFDAMEKHVNTMIFDVYNTASTKVDDVSEIVNASSGGLRQWADATSGIAPDVDALNERMIQELNNASGSIEEVKDTISTAQEQSVQYVSRHFTAAKTKMKKTSGDVIDKLDEKAVDLLTSKMPIGKVVGGGEGTEKSSLYFDYIDYMRIFLLFMSPETKVSRAQQLMQANVRYGTGDSSFTMANSYSSVWADMDCRIKFLFMSEPIVPVSLKQKGKLSFEVHTARAY